MERALPPVCWISACKGIAPITLLPFHYKQEDKTKKQTPSSQTVARESGSCWRGVTIIRPKCNKLYLTSHLFSLSWRRRLQLGELATEQDSSPLFEWMNWGGDVLRTVLIHLQKRRGGNIGVYFTVLCLDGARSWFITIGGVGLVFSINSSQARFGCWIPLSFSYPHPVRVSSGICLCCSFRGYADVESQLEDVAAFLRTEFFVSRGQDTSA